MVLICIGIMHNIPVKRSNIPVYLGVKMRKIGFTAVFVLLCVVIAGGASISAEPAAPGPVKTQEVSESDGIPVLIKHLPDWENVRNSARIAHSVDELRPTLGDRPVLNLIEFTGGNEAAAAVYPQGKVLIVEFASPQVSADLDARLGQQSFQPPIFFRRIGNYNAFVFDAADEAAANTLLDQIKYEKNIQWLGENPFAAQRAHQAERNFVMTTSDIFMSTLLAIVSGLGASIIVGIIAGFLFFYVREGRRAALPTFTDAGGMTRLNLDGFTPDIVPGGFLKE